MKLYFYNDKNELLDRLSQEFVDNLHRMNFEPYNSIELIKKTQTYAAFWFSHKNLVLDNAKEEENAKNDAKYEELSFAKTYLRYKYGNGEPMYVDISTMNFSMLTPNDFGNKIGTIKEIRFGDKATFSTAGLTLGTVFMEYLGDLKVRIIPNFVKKIDNEYIYSDKRYYDTYDFDIKSIDYQNMSQKEIESLKSRNNKTLTADFLHSVPSTSSNIKSDHMLESAGDGYKITKASFKIYFKGIGKISPNKN